MLVTSLFELPHSPPWPPWPRPLVDPPCPPLRPDPLAPLEYPRSDPPPAPGPVCVPGEGGVPPPELLMVCVPLDPPPPPAALNSVPLAPPPPPTTARRTLEPTISMAEAPPPPPPQRSLPVRWPPVATVMRRVVVPPSRLMSGTLTKPLAAAGIPPCDSWPPPPPPAQRRTTSGNCAVPTPTGTVKVPDDVNVCEPEGGLLVHVRSSPAPHGRSSTVVAPEHTVHGVQTRSSSPSQPPSAKFVPSTQDRHVLHEVPSPNVPAGHFPHVRGPSGSSVHATPGWQGCVVQLG